MESDEKPAVEALQGRLNSLNIEDGKKYLYNGLKLHLNTFIFTSTKLNVK
jgi:hypothetical protein